MPDLISQAISIAQEHGLKIIACGKDKAPLHRGWPDLATADPGKIREMFSHPDAALVGVPTGPVNDLLVVDIDFREGNTDERNSKLEQLYGDFCAEYAGEMRVHSTRNGGMHLIFGYPEGKGKIPRNLMPKCEVCYQGHQFIWPTEGSGYEVEVPVALDEIAAIERKHLKIREKMPGISSTGGLMTAETAHAVMLSDGEVGTRHEALLRMTQDWANAAPPEWADDEVCRSFEIWFRDNYGDAIEPTRLDELMNWRYEYGELMGSDLGNAMKGALKNATDRKVLHLATLERPKGLFDDRPALHGDSQEQAEQIMSAIAPEVSPEFPQPVVWGGSKAPPPRPWLLGKRLERRRLSIVQAPPGTGKTNITLAWILALASGTPILWDDIPAGPQTVLYWNGEDGVDEIMRRLAGYQKHYKLASSAVGARLRILPTDKTPLKLVRPTKKGPTEDVDAVETLRDILADAGADVLVIDPLIAAHQIKEADPAEMEVVLSVLRRLARELDIAVLMVHHKGKDAGGAVVGSARHVTTLQQIPADATGAYGVPSSDAHRFVELSDFKANNAGQGDPRWIELLPVRLGNGDDVYEQGDMVAVATRWDVRRHSETMGNILRAIEAIRQEWDNEEIEEHDKKVRQYPTSGHSLHLLLSGVFDKTWRPGVKAEKLTDAERADKKSIDELVAVLKEQKFLEDVEIIDTQRRPRQAWKLNEHRVDMFKRKTQEE